MIANTYLGVCVFLGIAFSVGTGRVGRLDFRHVFIIGFVTLYPCEK